MTGNYIRLDLMSQPNNYEMEHSCFGNKCYWDFFITDLDGYLRPAGRKAKSSFQEQQSGKKNISGVEEKLRK